MKVLFNNAPLKFRSAIKKVADKAAETLGQPQKLGVAVTFARNVEIRALNNEYRNVDKVTDVLSFPAIDNTGHGIISIENYPFETDARSGLLNLGDVIICLEVAKQQAEEYGHGLKRECAFLFLHGLLHLLGYDHIEEDDEREMKDTAEKILSACEIER